jgi:release factor glutamine methyltransferase
MGDPKAAWTILEILRWSTDYFRTKGVSEPRASTEVLLAHSLGISRLDLYLRYDQPLTPEELARFKALVVRRRQGEPVAYLTGRREFWSLDFQVTPAVLIPRPETETLVAAAIEAIKDFGAESKAPPPHPIKSDLPLGLEIGVGSGAVVIALARELPEMAWVGVDLSAAALAVAQENARHHRVLNKIHFLRGNLLAPLKPQGNFALVVANLPYVPRAEWEQLPREIKAYEPQGALLGGEDGLDLIRPLVRQAQGYVQPGGWILLEAGDRQAPLVAALLAETSAYGQSETIKDFNGVPRVVRARRSLD